MYKKRLLLLCALALTQCRNYSHTPSDWQLGSFSNAGMKPLMFPGTGGPEPDNPDNAAVIRTYDKFYMLYSHTGAHIRLAFYEHVTKWTSHSHHQVLWSALA